MFGPLHLKVLLLLELVVLALITAVAIVGAALLIVSFHAHHNDMNLSAFLDLDWLLADVCKFEVKRIVRVFIRVNKRYLVHLTALIVDLPAELDFQVPLVVTGEDTVPKEHDVPLRLKDDRISVVMLEAAVVVIVVILEAAPLLGLTARIGSDDEDLLALVQIRFLNCLLEVDQDFP